MSGRRATLVAILVACSAEAQPTPSEGASPVNQPIRASRRDPIAHGRPGNAGADA